MVATSICGVLTMCKALSPSRDWNDDPRQASPLLSGASILWMEGCDVVSGITEKMATGQTHEGLMTGDEYLRKANQGAYSHVASEGFAGWRWEGGWKKN